MEIAETHGSQLRASDEKGDAITPLFQRFAAAWRAELKFITRRARTKTRAHECRWTRKQPYDERLGRISR